MDTLSEFLLENRQAILLGAGALTLFLLARLPAWFRASRGGMWRAERDYARWQLRNALLALVLLVPLLIVTAAVSYL